MGLEQEIDRLLKTSPTVRENSLRMNGMNAHPAKYRSDLRESVGGNADCLPDGTSCYGINMAYDPKGVILYVGNKEHIVDGAHLPHVNFQLDLTENMVHQLNFWYAGSPHGKKFIDRPAGTFDPVEISICYPETMDPTDPWITNLTNTAALYNILWTHDLIATTHPQTHRDLLRKEDRIRLSEQVEALQQRLNLQGLLRFYGQQLFRR